MQALRSLITAAAGLRSPHCFRERVHADDRALFDAAENASRAKSQFMANEDTPAPKLGRHLLVIEDNPVNQEVMSQMLRTLGCRVRVAAGALEGLRALCEDRFDLVLMDMQMPGMDLGLGFDDYLSKPFRQSQLLAMLKRRLPATLPADRADEAGSAGHGDGGLGDGGGVLDAEALARLRELDPGGKTQLLARVLRTFLASLERLLPQMNEARATDDLGGVRHVAHTLKSSSASIGALQLSQLCASIEKAARQNQAADLPSMLDDMDAEVERVRAALKTMLDA